MKDQAMMEAVLAMMGEAGPARKASKGANIAAGDQADAMAAEEMAMMEAMQNAEASSPYQGRHPLDGPSPKDNTPQQMMQAAEAQFIEQFGYAPETDSDMMLMDIFANNLMQGRGSSTEVMDGDADD